VAHSVTQRCRHQALHASAYHIYAIKQLRMSSTILLNKFYNGGSDTGFVYYNATNLYVQQQFFFKAFTAGIAVSRTRNATYQLYVMDENIQLHLKKAGAIGFGVKVNNLVSRQLVKAGVYLNANIKVYRQDMLYLSYEQGYLPGFHKGLVKNDMATVRFVKNFGFRM
jgi:hypothetical protein